MTEPTHGEIYSRLGVIEGKLDQYINSQSVTEQRQFERLRLIENRAQSLEKSRSYAQGVMGVLAALALGAWAHILDIFKLMR